MKRLSWAAVVVGVAACTNEPAMPAEPGLGEPNPLVEGANEVQLYVIGRPLMVAYRNGTSGWGTPAELEDGVYRLMVDTRYEVVVACGGWPFFDSEVHARVYADGASDFIVCSAYEFKPAPPVTVQMDVMQAGHVWMYEDYGVDLGPWQFIADVPSGTHDLVGVDSTHRMALRRNVEIPEETESMTLDALDFDAEGTAMRPHPISVYGETEDEVLTSQLVFSTRNEYSQIDGTDTMLYAPPESLMSSDDFAYFHISADLESTSRSVSAPITTTRHDFAFLPVLDPHAYYYSIPDNDNLRAEWTELPEFDQLGMSLYGYTSTQRLIVTRGFVEETGKKAIQFSGPPGFQPEWRVDLVTPYYRELSLDQFDGDDRYSTSRFDLVENVLGN